jgi:UDP-N-acetylmuramyl pentapeptide phosphotransferase/UDP-N-acetylglucosamine-1-phosphate transferase
VTRPRRSQWSMVAAGGVVIAAGLAVGLVEVYRFPKGSIWVVVGVTVALVLLIRVLDRRRP